MAETLLSDNLADYLRSMLGATKRHARHNWGYRNRFCVTVNTPSEADLKRLCELGLAERTMRFNDGKSAMYSATVEGMRAIGFTEKDIQRALEP